MTKVHLFPNRVQPNHYSFVRCNLKPESIDTTDYLLWSMMVMTDQRFPPAVLALYEHSPKYFESNGMPVALFVTCHQYLSCRGYEVLHTCPALVAGVVF